MLTQRGTVVDLITVGLTGECPEDPLYNVEFDDGIMEQYWSEELEAAAGEGG